jgi:3-methyladenine DNA glycosylase/8-oxoguanine DNA glycosylase
VRLTTTRPLDLGATLGAHRKSASDPTLLISGDEAVWAMRTPDGSGTLHLRRTGAGVEAQAWGAGAGWLLDLVPDLLGEHDRLDGFVPVHPAVVEAHRRRPGLRIGRSRAVTTTLLAVVLEQRVTSIEAARQWRALCHRFGEPAPGPLRLQLPPDPDALVAVPYWVFHRLGVERRRADTIRRVAARARALDALAARPLRDATAALATIAGVGAWSVASTAGTALGDPDAVPVGDYHLPHMVAWALAGERRGDDARMLELLKPYAGHRGRALRLLASTGAFPPRRAPRRAIPPIHAW